MVLYCVSKEDLIQLQAGKVSVEELTKPENEILVVLLGEDLKEEMKNKGKGDWEKFRYEVAKALEFANCDICLWAAIEAAESD
jgi:hypothetical protein